MIASPDRHKAKTDKIDKRHKLRLQQFFCHLISFDQSIYNNKKV